MLKRITVSTIILIIIIFLVCAVAGCTSNKAHEGMYYAKSAVVTTIDNVRNLVGFTDTHGDEWYWYCDTSAAPWALDDEVLLVMCDNGTAWKYDDTMVSITTEGIITETVTR